MARVQKPFLTMLETSLKNHQGTFYWSTCGRVDRVPVVPPVVPPVAPPVVVQVTVVQAVVVEVEAMQEAAAEGEVAEVVL
jgi:hypothetical protein